MCFALVSCNLFPISSVKGNENTEENQLASESDKIVLGDKIYNPFSIDNMMARGVDASDEESNWYYFRLRQAEIDASAMESCYPNNSNLVDLIESWGYFVGPYCMAWKYGKVGKTQLKNNELSLLELYKNKDYYINYGDTGYFYSGGLYDLLDSSNEAENYKYDYCSGYKVKDIFAAYKSGVRDLNSLADIIAKNKNCSEYEKINIKNTIFNKKKDI